MAYNRTRRAKLEQDEKRFQQNLGMTGMVKPDISPPKEDAPAPAASSSGSAPKPAAPKPKPASPKKLALDEQRFADDLTHPTKRPASKKSELEERRFTQDYTQKTPKAHSAWGLPAEDMSGSYAASHHPASAGGMNGPYDPSTGGYTLRGEQTYGVPESRAEDSTAGFILQSAGTGLSSAMTGIAEAGGAAMEQRAYNDYDTGFTLGKGAEWKNLLSAARIAHSLSPALATMTYLEERGNPFARLVWEEDEGFLDNLMTNLSILVGEGTEFAARANPTITMMQAGYDTLMKNSSAARDAADETLAAIDDLSVRQREKEAALQEAASRQSEAVQLAGEIAYGTGNFAPSLAASLAHPAVGIAVAAVSSGGRAAKDAALQGADPNQALKVGVINGALDAVVEKTFGGIKVLGKGVLSKPAQELLDKALKSPQAKKMIFNAVNMVGEGLENAVTTYLSGYIDRAVYNGEAELATWQELLHDGAMGVIMSAIFGGFDGDAYTDAYAKNIDTPQKADASVSRAKASLDPEVRTQADQIDAYLQSGGSVPDAAPRIAQMETSDALRTGTNDFDTAPAPAAAPDAPRTRATAQKYDVPEGEAARVGELSERLGTPVEFSDGVVESGMYYNGAIRIAPESSTPAHDVLACDLSRSMQKDPTDYDAFSGALSESPFYKEELSRRGLTPEAYRTSIEQAVKKTSGVGLPKEQAQYEAAMRFAKEVLFEDPAAIARFKQADAELFSRVKSWTERVHARLSGSSQENAASALWSMYDKADGGSGSGGTGRANAPDTLSVADPAPGEAQTIEINGQDGDVVFVQDAEYNENDKNSTKSEKATSTQSAKETKTLLLKKNREQGRAFEQEQFEIFSTQWENAVEQITIKTTVGTRTRVDAIGFDEDGKIVIAEFKSSQRAPLTRRQKQAFPEIFNAGGVVTGKGKGLFLGGVQIPAGTQVTIIRKEQ